ncbi:divalent-cation tolerance protein CutA [Halorhodospira neutriphila]|uniref:Divalent-cation tolerance protein CutA n=1 Tax=Halorhodospira neutriphila TaxID=168379 RepID=A0ABS1E3B6_9GAMM|nr:divalent-cation tolerance protein CutA [Halorhodospira neutriphila]MBK1725637.1 divalent-cation tolerance protein CutA [Halorhodospira neutriphila]
MASTHLIALCTCPDEATARRLASEVVEAGLAACVNILPGVTSVFYWEGEAQSEPEQLLLIKTTDTAYSRLEAHLVASHPYELPEVVAVGIEKGLQGFLDWIAQQAR